MEIRDIVAIISAAISAVSLFIAISSAIYTRKNNTKKYERYFMQQQVY